MTTYYEKLRQAVKIDRELLNEDGAEQLERQLNRFLTYERCPGDFFPGAPCPDREDVCPEVKISCSRCWRREATSDDPRV